MHAASCIFSKSAGHTREKIISEECNGGGGGEEQKILKDLTKSEDNKDTMIRPEESCYDFL